MAENTREQIISAAGVLFAKKGFFGVSMQAIADAVGITKPALYHHFKSKEELCLKVLQSSFTDLTQSLHQAAKRSEDPAEALIAMVDAYLSLSLKQPQVRLLFAQESKEVDTKVARFLNQSLTKIRTLFAASVQSHLKAQNQEKEEVQLLVSSVLSILLNPTLLFKSSSRPNIRRFLNNLLNPRA